MDQRSDLLQLALQWLGTRGLIGVFLAASTTALRWLLGFDGTMDVNIAIRTLVYSRSEIRFWAGGGIVADSTLEDEYQETFDKAAAMLKLLQQAASGSLDRQR